MLVAPMPRAGGGPFWAGARLVRALGIAAIAGLAAGLLVGGLGGRIVMRLVTLSAGPGSLGLVSDNGGRLGALTLEGTLELLAFGGIGATLLGSLAYVALRPALRGLGGWQGLAFGFLLLGAFGSIVIDSRNGD